MRTCRICGQFFTDKEHWLSISKPHLQKELEKQSKAIDDLERINENWHGVGSRDFVWIKDRGVKAHTRLTEYLEGESLPPSATTEDQNVVRKAWAGREKRWNKFVEAYRKHAANFYKRYELQLDLEAQAKNGNAEAKKQLDELVEIGKREMSEARNAMKNYIESQRELNKVLRASMDNLESTLRNVGAEISHVSGRLKDSATQIRTANERVGRASKPRVTGAGHFVAMILDTEALGTNDTMASGYINSLGIFDQTIAPKTICPYFFIKHSDFYRKKLEGILAPILSCSVNSPVKGQSQSPGQY